MKLIELNPRWFDVPGIGTNKDGMTFVCPCAKCQPVHENSRRLGIQFANPVGGEPLPLMTQKQKMVHVHELRTFDIAMNYLWQRTGETFEDMTLSPSIDASNSGHWHGHITNGAIA